MLGIYTPTPFVLLPVAIAFAVVLNSTRHFFLTLLKRNNITHIMIATVLISMFVNAVLGYSNKVTLTGFDYAIAHNTGAEDCTITLPSGNLQGHSVTSALHPDLCCRQRKNFSADEAAYLSFGEPLFGDASEDVVLSFDLLDYVGTHQASVVMASDVGEAGFNRLSATYNGYTHVGTGLCGVSSTASSAVFTCYNASSAVAVHFDNQGGLQYGNVVLNTAGGQPSGYMSNVVLTVNGASEDAAGLDYTAGEFIPQPYELPTTGILAPTPLMDLVGWTNGALQHKYLYLWGDYEPECIIKVGKTKSGAVFARDTLCMRKCYEP